MPEVMESEMVERVAQAMAAAYDAVAANPQGYVIQADRDAARAAIEAMREPTEMMVRATVTQTDHTAEHLDRGAAVIEGMPPLAPHRQRDGILAAADIWRDWEAMIDAALAGGKAT